MCADFNTWIVTGTINTPFSVFSAKQRFDHTMKTLESVNKKDPTAKIIVIDNSINSLSDEQVCELRSRCTVLHQFVHNVFSRFCNSSKWNKGIGEILMTEIGMQIAEDNNWIGNRIFKICGRYMLTNDFDIAYYNNPAFENKYVYKNTVWAFDTQGTVEYKQFIETKLWSLCGSLFQEYKELLLPVIAHMCESNDNIEITLNKLLPADKRIVVPILGVQGWYATGEYVQA